MKNFIVLCLLFAVVSQVPSVFAQGLEDESLPKFNGLLRGQVDIVHHDKQQLVINDRLYIMPLNFKVLDAAGRNANRFAIKAGAAVEYFSRYDEKTKNFYVDSLQLLN